MSKAVYAGSFDPITNGHIDIISRASKLFDEVVVLLAINPDKTYRFSLEDRKQMIEGAIKEANLDNVTVASTDGLTVKFAKSVNATHLIRGLRQTDISYEMNMSETNKKLDPSLDTIFLLSNKELNHISSTLVKEMIDKKQDIKGLVPESVIKFVKR